MIIKAIDQVCSHRQGSISPVTKEQIVKKLGFEPNVEDDPCKVVSSWAFTADGTPCAIWDYRGSQQWNQYSVFGPAYVFETLFPGKWRHQ